MEKKGYYRSEGRQSFNTIKSVDYKLSALEIKTTLLYRPNIFVFSDWTGR